MFCIDIAGFLKNDYLHIFVKIHCTDKEGLLNFKNIEVIYW